jgi:hypothetical protein
MVKNWDLLTNITFKTQCYRKNFDMISTNEHFITECDGEITLMRFEQEKPLLIVGEYGFSIWNIKLGNQFNVNFKNLIEEHNEENIYHELNNLINRKKFELNSYNKIILVHSLVLRADYRKQGITEEFTELLYRDYYSDGDAIIMLVLPFQNNPIDKEYYMQRKTVPVRQNLSIYQSPLQISAAEYYSLDTLIGKNDDELNEYKLFSVASKCGLSRIDDSHLFLFSPEKTIERMNKKYNN